MSEFQGKSAFVTGAGSGLGKSVALLLARSGANVGLVGRTKEELEQTAHEIGDRATVLLADIAKEEEIRSACDRFAEERGSLDIVFANAGVNGVWAPLDELTLEDWSHTIGINLTGTFLTIKSAFRYLKRRGGSVIVTSSVNGTRIFSNTGATAYSTSKAGQVALAKMLALELAQWRIRVNVICPGAIESEISDNTEMRNTEKVKVPAEFPEGEIPLTRGRPGKAEDVAELVAFLASDRSAHISGTEIWIDGAESLLVG